MGGGGKGGLRGGDMGGRLGVKGGGKWWLGGWLGGGDEMVLVMGGRGLKRGAGSLKGGWWG